jgi:hypothetical protein
MTRSFRTTGIGVVALCTFALILLPARDLRSGDDSAAGKACPLEGAWKQTERKNGDSQAYEKLPEGIEMIKYITGGRFVWTIVRDGRIQGALGGKYTIEKDKYTEHIEYSHGEGNEALVGKSFDFTWKVDGNSFHQVGAITINNQEFKIDEKYERCK